LPTADIPPAVALADAEAAPAVSIDDAGVDAPVPGAEEQAPTAPEVDLDVVYWATPESVVDKMLEVAKVEPSDVLYDLGCGDARILVLAAKRYGTKGFGFDLDPRRVREARENARRNGVHDLVQIEQKDIFTLDLSPADVVFLFLLPKLNVRLMPRLKKLHRGARIVSHEFSMAGAKPARVVHVLGPPDGPPVMFPRHGMDTHTLYLWDVPWQKQGRAK
jgi:SAM-dependent methyltransferase